MRNCSSSIFSMKVPAYPEQARILLLLAVRCLFIFAVLSMAFWHCVWAEDEISRHDSGLAEIKIPETFQQAKIQSLPALPNIKVKNPDSDSREARTWAYVGNVESMKFHHADCEFASIMSASKRVGFQSLQQAIDAGMKPCNWCQPKWWTRVEARIIYPITGDNETIGSP